MRALAACAGARGELERVEEHGMSELREAPGRPQRDADTRRTVRAGGGQGHGEGRQGIGAW